MIHRAVEARLAGAKGDPNPATHPLEKQGVVSDMTETVARRVVTLALVWEDGPDDNPRIVTQTIGTIEAEGTGEPRLRLDLTFEPSVFDHANGKSKLPLGPSFSEQCARLLEVVGEALKQWGPLA